MRWFALFMCVCVCACAHTNTRKVECSNGDSVWVERFESKNEYLARTVEHARGMRKCARRAMVKALEEE